MLNPQTLSDCFNQKQMNKTIPGLFLRPRTETASVDTHGQFTFEAGGVSRCSGHQETLASRQIALTTHARPPA